MCELCYIKFHFSVFVPCPSFVSHIYGIKIEFELYIYPQAPIFYFYFYIRVVLKLPPPNKVTVYSSHTTFITFSASSNPKPLYVSQTSSLVRFFCDYLIIWNNYLSSKASCCAITIFLLKCFRIDLCMKNTLQLQKFLQQ